MGRNAIQENSEYYRSLKVGDIIWTYRNVPWDETPIQKKIAAISEYSEDLDRPTAVTLVNVDQDLRQLDRASKIICAIFYIIPPSQLEEIKDAAQKELFQSLYNQIYNAQTAQDIQRLDLYIHELENPGRRHFLWQQLFMVEESIFRQNHPQS